MIRFAARLRHERKRRTHELEALRLVEQQPGITIAELADELGVTMNRAWQITGRLEGGRVRLDRS
jgi:predicted DNA-binding protein (UPF0251 family)